MLLYVNNSIFTDQKGMPASKNKSLDPQVQEATAMLWANNGDDVNLLLYSREKQRFVRCCKCNKKCLSVLNLGAWVKISFQDYEKTRNEGRIHLQSCVKMVGLMATRVVCGTVQFSLFAQLIKGDPYFNEFHYHCQFGNIKLNAEQGGGPGQLQIWCHLQTLAWWLDPIFDELVQVDDLSMPSTSSASHLRPNQKVFTFHRETTTKMTEENKATFHDVQTVEGEDVDLIQFSPIKSGQQTQMAKGKLKLNQKQEAQEQQQHHTPASSQIEHEEFVDKKDADTDEDLILFTSPVKTTDVPRKLKQQTKSSAVRKLPCYPDDYEYKEQPPEPEEKNEEKQDDDELDESTGLSSRLPSEVDDDTVGLPSEVDDDTIGLPSEVDDDTIGLPSEADYLGLSDREDDAMTVNKEEDDESIGLSSRMVNNEEDESIGLSSRVGDLELSDHEDDDAATIKYGGSNSPTMTPASSRSSSPLPEWDAADFEPVELDRHHLNVQFDWNRYQLGIVVEVMDKSRTIKRYQVWPFGIDQEKPPELVLYTETSLELGQWIKFEKGEMTNDEIREGKWWVHEALFHTIPCRDKVLIECQICNHGRTRRLIHTKWNRYIPPELKQKTRQSDIPFINHIKDEFRLLRTDEFYGNPSEPWATLEYKRVPFWGREDAGQWRLLFLRPKCYGESSR